MRSSPAKHRVVTHFYELCRNNNEKEKKKKNKSQVVCVCFGSRPSIFRCWTVSLLMTAILLFFSFHKMKRKWEKEHNELEETKRILKESGVNVAQCLANLPQPAKSSSASAEGPVSKRRASFPAAPFRRVSLKNPPPVTNKVLQTSGDSAVSSEPVSSSPIEEEKEEATDSVGGTGETAQEANQPQQRHIPTPPPLPPPSSSAAADKAAVTIQQRRGYSLPFTHS